MSIVLRTLPEPAPGETAPYCVMQERLEKSRAHSSFIFTGIAPSESFRRF